MMRSFTDFLWQLAAYFASALTFLVSLMLLLNVFSFVQFPLSSDSAQAALAYFGFDRRTIIGVSVPTMMLFALISVRLGENIMQNFGWRAQTAWLDDGLNYFVGAFALSTVGTAVQVVAPGTMSNAFWLYLVLLLCITTGAIAYGTTANIGAGGKLVR